MSGWPELTSCRKNEPDIPDIEKSRTVADFEGVSVGIWSLRSGFNPHTESCFGLIWAHFVMRSPGRTSIKVALPAIWKHQDHIRNHPWFAEYHLEKGTQGWDDPYKALPRLPLGGPENEAEEDLVSDGTGAIRVYQQLLLTADLTESVRTNHKQLLLQYCKLDTAAMVMIWRHWVGGLKKANS